MPTCPTEEVRVSAEVRAEILRLRSQELRTIGDIAALVGMTGVDVLLVCKGKLEGMVGR